MILPGFRWSVIILLLRWRKGGDESWMICPKSYHHPKSKSGFEPMSPQHFSSTTKRKTLFPLELIFPRWPAERGRTRFKFPNSQPAGLDLIQFSYFIVRAVRGPQALFHTHAGVRKTPTAMAVLLSGWLGVPESSWAYRCFAGSEKTRDGRGCHWSLVLLQPEMLRSKRFQGRGR